MSRSFAAQICRASKLYETIDRRGGLSPDGGEAAVDLEKHLQSWL